MNSNTSDNTRIEYWDDDDRSLRNLAFPCYETVEHVDLGKILKSIVNDNQPITCDHNESDCEYDEDEEEIDEYNDESNMRDHFNEFYSSTYCTYVSRSNTPSVVDSPRASEDGYTCDFDNDPSVQNILDETEDIKTVKYFYI